MSISVAVRSILLLNRIMTNTNPAKPAPRYLVRIVTEVDRPWLRCPSYLVVQAGHRMTTTIECATQAGALRELAAVLAGAYDCGSEYVVKVSVDRRTATGRRVTVRKTVERTLYRAPSATVDPSLGIDALACRAIRAGRSWTRMNVSWHHDVFTAASRFACEAA